MTAHIMDEVALKRYYARATVDLETGCWLFKSATFYLDGERRTVYEVAYETFVDMIPTGFVLGHTCANDTNARRRSGQICGFWEHVRPITQVQNLQEARGTIEACPQGHPRIAQNKYKCATMCAACARIRTAHARGATCCLGCGFSKCKCGEERYG